MSEIEWTPVALERARRGECPACGDPDFVETGIRKVEESGSGFTGEYTVHWWRGTMTCAECGTEVAYGDSN